MNVPAGLPVLFVIVNMPWALITGVADAAPMQRPAARPYGTMDGGSGSKMPKSSGAVF